MMKITKKRNMKPVICLTFVFSFILSFIILGFAQDSVQIDNSPLINKLKENSRPITYRNGKLVGMGADFLFKEAEKSQFFLVGEEHGIAENPLFAAAVLHELNRFGYKYFAAEIGRLTATRLEKSAQTRAAREVFADFNRRYPFSLPFFNWKEEGILLETIFELPAGKISTIWGLDQEFFFSPIYHFERLRELAPNPKSKAIVNEYYEKIRFELIKSTETKNPSDSFLITARQTDFVKLRVSFGKKDTEAQQIINDLQKSAEIYQKNFRGEIYANNLQRSQLLKRRFMEYYNLALMSEKKPKVFFKFGAGHVSRGRNYVNVFDVGNLASEIAETNGLNSFHVLVLAANGAQNKFFPFVGNESDKKKPLDAAKVYSYFEVKPFTQLAEGTGWQVIDLRPLRSSVGTKRLGKLPNGVAELIFNFDAVLLVAYATPATFFNYQ